MRLAAPSSSSAPQSRKPHYLKANAMSHQIKSLVLTLILIGLITFSIHLLHKPQTMPNQQIHPDFIIINGHYKDYNQKGKLSQQVWMKTTKHYKKGDSSLFNYPLYIQYNPDGSKWQLTSIEGQSDHGDTHIHLQKQVVVHQMPKTHRLPITTLKTSQLEIYPHQSLATSNQHVTMIRDNTVAHGVGLRCNLKTGVSEILSHSNAIVTPKEKASSKH